VKFQTHVPRAPLDQFVERLWHCADVPPHARERILPSGTVELVVNLREDEIRVHDSVLTDRFQKLSGAAVSGTYTQCFVIDPSQHASMLGVHFRPGGAFPFLGMTLSAIADAHVDLADLWGTSAVELRERLVTARSEVGLPPKLFGRLRRFQRARLRAVALGSPTWSHLAADHGYFDQSHLIRDFQAFAGMSPAAYLRQRSDAAMPEHVPEPAPRR
jgi:AraC-like DNA-binding protein